MSTGVGALLVTLFMACTAAVVLVATVRALKLHGGADRKELAAPDAVWGGPIRG